MELPALMLNNVASVGDLGGSHPMAQSLHQQSPSSYNSMEKQLGKGGGVVHRSRQGAHPRGPLRSQQREEDINAGHLYPYSIDTFSDFGTVTCYAENSYGSSGPCYYHILAAGTITEQVLF